MMRAEETESKMAQANSVTRKQKRLGPAPIASFDTFDMSDEVRIKLESSMSSENRLPDIREHQSSAHRLTITTNAGGGDQTTTTASHVGATTTLSVQTPTTPRIDISRASSSSQHEDSRDSSPENIFEQVIADCKESGSKSGTGKASGRSGSLGFQEEGTLDLRSSTEELFFMEPEKGSVERERPMQLNQQQQQQQQQQQTSRRSPVMFRFEEAVAGSGISILGRMGQRKDSASSEVAALLCISGRTSRISSVGSQGSAVSRLSAVSGVSGMSRSPSPHRMLLETSFCGPKLTEASNNTSGGTAKAGHRAVVDELEQVILARRHDPTQAVIAEGITLVQTPSQPSAPVQNGNAAHEFVPLAEVHIPKLPSPTGRTKRSGSASSTKTVVGTLPSGTEYIRINLKPDHMYGDNGVASHEQTVDELVGLKKPATLSFGRSETGKQHAAATASPKPARHQALTAGTVAAAAGSRSPSPAISLSRKSSFASLFKGKDTATALSPDSPTGVRERKKSSISVLLRDQGADSPGEPSRSRSKSRDRAVAQSPCQMGTPNKQKSVLAIFRPKRSGSKSKSSSPVDPQMMAGIDGGLAQVEFRFAGSEVPSPAGSNDSRSKQKLRYYDQPLDGKSIHIPLHTPPDERDDCTPGLSIAATSSRQPNNFSAETQRAPVPIPAPPSQSQPQPQQQQPPPRPPKGQLKSTKDKVYRFENPDGSIRIPLRSPTEEHPPPISAPIKSAVPKTASPSTASVKPNSGTATKVIGSKPTPTSMSTDLPKQRPTVQPPPPPPPPKTQPVVVVNQPERGKRPAWVEKSPPLEDETSPDVAAPPLASATTAESNRRHIMFKMRLGSGSQEQIFTTQLSLSKTASLSSQLSEPEVPVSPPKLEEKDEELLEAAATPETKAPREQMLHRSDTVVLRRRDPDESSAKAKLQRELACIETGADFEEPLVTTLTREDVVNANRHSRFVGGDELDDMLRENHRQKDRPGPILELPGPPADRASVVSTDDPPCSSESEKESEPTVDSSTRPRRHLPRNIGAIEDHESAGLVSQESFDEELPYVPTTLPEERTIGVSIIPVRERTAMDVRTCPVDRPRSTTPIHPACLEEFCADDNDNSLIQTTAGEKLRISLPLKEIYRGDRTGGTHQRPSKSPRRISNASSKSWFEFAEQGLAGRRNSNQDDEPPPPLPPRKPVPSVIAAVTGSPWINFENIPEKRKPPKRITTLPNSKGGTTPGSVNTVDVLGATGTTLPGGSQYGYVNPDECQCECHEGDRHEPINVQTPDDTVTEKTEGEETQPLLELEGRDTVDRTSMSDSSMEYSFGGNGNVGGADLSYAVDPNGPDLTRPYDMERSMATSNASRDATASSQQDFRSQDTPRTSNQQQRRRRI